MLDTSMCFADLCVGDWFETNRYSDNGSKRYEKLSVDRGPTGAEAKNAVELVTGQSVWFESEDRVTLLPGREW